MSPVGIVDSEYLKVGCLILRSVMVVGPHFDRVLAVGLQVDAHPVHVWLVLPVPAPVVAEITVYGPPVHRVGDHEVLFGCDIPGGVQHVAVRPSEIGIHFDAVHVSADVVDPNLDLVRTGASLAPDFDFVPTRWSGPIDDGEAVAAVASIVGPACPIPTHHVSAVVPDSSD